MKILLTGSGGQLGQELQRSLAPLGELVACNHARLDLADADAVRAMVRIEKPDIIINAAAWTAVDQAETHETEATKINAEAPRILAEETALLGARLIHFSTDYVFDGSKPAPYVESDECAPLSVYGRSKRAGELNILSSGADAITLRTSWVYGAHGANFMKTMLRLANERDEISVVDDQFGAPTWTRHLADATASLISDHPNASGIYHLTAAGETSWYEYAETIFAEALRLGLIRKIPLQRRVASTNWPTPAKRPNNSRLDCAALRRDTGIALPDWRSGLFACLAEMQS
ncbi:MAG: dTDP-4-dehydrorhamnose reductase [Rhodocyclaceae bacterium]|nr:dTDP-4-dehydrorhamnose reductase [Rhodocyclaceae bacterium]